MITIKLRKLRSIKGLLYVILISICGCQKPPKVAYNIPYLLGRNIDEVRKILDNPLESPADPLSSKKESYDNIYKKDGQTLLISYNLRNRKISSFFIVSSVEYENVKDIMKVGNLDSLETKAYLAEPERPFGTTAYNSIKIKIK